MDENALQNAKRRLLRKYDQTCPIGNETVEAILDDFIREYLGKEEESEKSDG